MLEPQMTFNDRIRGWMVNNPEFMPRQEEMKLFMRGVKKSRLKTKNQQQVTLNADMEVS